jgi:hypothetical protein
MKRLLHTLLAAPLLLGTAALLTACGDGSGLGLPGASGAGSGATGRPASPTFTLNPQSIKDFEFTWTDVPGAPTYRLLENPDGASGYTAITGTLPAGTTTHHHTVFLPERLNARYVLQACNSQGCTDSAPVAVSGNLAPAVGYFKASNPDALDHFGDALALSADGSTLAVGAPLESGSSTTVNGPDDNGAAGAGAVYVFKRSDTGWQQEAYVKGSHTVAGTGFGASVALSAHGDTLAVGAPGDDSGTTGIDSDPSTAPARSNSGSVYVFQRSGATWSQQAYIKSFNSGGDDAFGSAVSLSGNGDLLAVGAPAEDGAGTGIDPGDNDGAADSGAVYVYARTGAAWQAIHYVKASNAEAGDRFGGSLVLSGDATVMAVGAILEDGGGRGVSLDETSNTRPNSGAVYLFDVVPGALVQYVYLKSPNSDDGDFFGDSLALSADGKTLAVGAYNEDSSSSGVNQDANNNDAAESGAVYVFRRSDGGWFDDGYLKASNTVAGQRFGHGLALSPDGLRLAVGAMFDASDATGLGGDATNTALPGSGAVHLFTRQDGTGWAHASYVKAPGPNSQNMHFGRSVALGVDEQGLVTLAASAAEEDSTAAGIGGVATTSGSADSGAVYLY